VSEESVRLVRPAYIAAPPPLQSRFIRWAVHTLAPDTECSRERAEAAAQLFISGHRRQRVELPGGLSAMMDRDDVIVARLGSRN